jgi:hypothetical protein
MPYRSQGVSSKAQLIGQTVLNAFILQTAKAFNFSFPMVKPIEISE